MYFDYKNYLETVLSLRFYPGTYLIKPKLLDRQHIVQTGRCLESFVSPDDVGCQSEIYRKATFIFLFKFLLITITFLLHFISLT